MTVAVPQATNGVPPKSATRSKAIVAAMSPDCGRHGLSPLEMISQWRSEGALERLATSWPTFDRVTRGGFVLGRLAFILGAPNAAKTALAAYLAWLWLHDGVAVGALCVDEDAHDFLTRLAVMAGVTLDDAEKRAPATLAIIEAAIGPLPLRLYDGAWTIEAAAADFHSWMKSRGLTRGAFIADSVQTITCDAALDASALRAFVGANVKALATVAARHRLAVISTGEIPRAAYDGGRGDDLKAGKESGAIEFAAKIQIVLRRVKRHDDLIRVTVPKIKRGEKDEAELYLRFDRATHSLSEDPTGAAKLTAPSDATASRLRERILEVTRAAPMKGQELDTPSAVARKAGGKYQAAFAIAKELIAADILKLVKGSYRSTPEARS